MKKSVYSLVLADDVIEAIDNLAYQMNTSRSNLINQILAAVTVQNYNVVVKPFYDPAELKSIRQKDRNRDFFFSGLI